ncbi:MAG TPA: 2Fe-2S iron-sulfur cluster-binding protein [Blastocatellia bacterium]|nr:2Fe-2S iron-sulfur cluster-binding protein [Blastocatellia bacterium]
MSSEPRQHKISFSPESHRSVMLVRGSVLSEHLTIENSPVLFGCRTGICGTCLVEVEEEMNGRLLAPSADESELLEIIAPDISRARLACQVELRADIKVKYIGPR